MARPIKNNADYFPHDADMRNDPRIKALRRKFGLEGYAIYSMMLELLTDSDFFEFKNNGLSMELVSGDFDIETDKLCSILQYCFQLDLFQLDAKTNIISCKSLDNRLEPLLSKRKRDRIESPSAITPELGITVSESTQSKVKESKGDKSKEKESKATVAKAPEITALPFESKEFWEAWVDWCNYKKERKQKFTPRTKEMQLRKLGARPESEAIAMLKQSIENGWTGLFPIKANYNATNGNKKQQSDASVTASVEQHYRDKLAKRELQGTGS